MSKKAIIWIVVALVLIALIILSIYLYKRSKNQAGPTSTVHPTGTTVTTLPGGGPSPSIG